MRRKANKTNKCTLITVKAQVNGLGGYANCIYANGKEGGHFFTDKEVGRVRDLEEKRVCVYMCVSAWGAAIKL